MNNFINLYLEQIQKGLFKLDTNDLLVKGLDTLHKRNCSQGINYYACTLDSNNITTLNPAGKWEPLKHFKVVLIVTLDGKTAWADTTYEPPKWSKVPAKSGYILRPPTDALNCTKWLEKHSIDKLEKQDNRTIRIPVRCIKQISE